MLVFFFPLIADWTCFHFVYFTPPKELELLFGRISKVSLRVFLHIHMYMCLYIYICVCVCHLSANLAALIERVKSERCLLCPCVIFLCSDMLPEAVLPPSKEHSYAQWLERSYQSRESRSSQMGNTDCTQLLFPIKSQQATISQGLQTVLTLVTESSVTTGIYLSVWLWTKQ